MVIFVWNKCFLLFLLSIITTWITLLIVFLKYSYVIERILKDINRNVTCIYIYLQPIRWPQCLLRQILGQIRASNQTIYQNTNKWWLQTHLRYQPVLIWLFSVRNYTEIQYEGTLVFIKILFRSLWAISCFNLCAFKLKITAAFVPNCSCVKRKRSVLKLRRCSTDPIEQTSVSNPGSGPVTS